MLIQPQGTSQTQNHTRELSPTPSLLPLSTSSPRAPSPPRCEHAPLPTGKTPARFCKRCLHVFLCKLFLQTFFFPPFFFNGEMPTKTTHAPNQVHQIQLSGEQEWKPGRSLER